MYHLQTMGRLAITRGRSATEPLMIDQKPLILVAFLALTPGHRVRRDHLAELLWPGNGHSTSRRSLRQALYTLSKQLDGPVIESDDGDLVLSDRLASCDAWDLDEAIAASDPQRVFELSSRPFLETMARGLGREMQEWIELHNQRLRAKRRDALRALIKRAVAHERLDEAEWYARAWVGDEPLAEEPRAALVRILKAGGDEAGAYQAYEEYRTLLRSAVGDEPSDRLSESVEEVRSILLEDDEWRPITNTAERLLTRRDARRYVAWILAAGVLLGFGLFGTLFVTVDRGGDGPVEAGTAGPAWGGGEVVIETAGAFRTLRYDGDAAEWRLESPGWTAPASGSNRPPQGPFRLATGDLIWTTGMRGPDDPPYPLVRASSGWLPVRITEGDNGWAVPAPDGRRFLVSAQRMDAAPFAKDLYIVSLDWVEGRPGAPPPRRILTGTEQVGPYYWAPDGLAIAAVARGTRDRIVVLRPSGDPIVDVPFHDVLNVAWCGSSRRLSAVVSDEAGTRAVSIDPETGRVATVASDALAEVLACSPDGRGVVYLAAMDLEPRLHLVDVESGEVEVLPGDELVSALSRLQWLPDRPTGPVRALAIEGGDQAIGWGESRSLNVSLSGPDAAALVRRISWTSTDPWVASVSPEGTLHANGRGTVGIIASLHGWVADTLRVTVVGERPPELALVDSFEALDGGRWHVAGVPTPALRSTDGGSALWLRGDGRYSDGLISRESFALDRGGRLDFEFSFRPTRPAHERLVACLRDVEPGTRTEGGFGATRNMVCFAYPARELEKFDPSEGRLIAAPGIHVDVPFTPASTDEWTRITLEIRPDGAPTLWIDGEVRATGPLRIEGLTHPSWHVTLTGSSTDPPLLVRNVALWVGSEAER